MSMLSKKPASAAGLRARKKLSTRRAIEEAAISLFIERGYEATTLEQIAERAEISPATFFRYFSAKYDPLLSEVNTRLPLLREAFRARPSSETDLQAARAVYIGRSRDIDLVKQGRLTRTFWSTPMLEGVRFKIQRAWQTGLSEVFAERHGLTAPSAECVLTARVVLGIVSTAFEEWGRGGHREQVELVLDRHFDSLERLSVEWAKAYSAPDSAAPPSPRKKRKTG